MSVTFTAAVHPFVVPALPSFRAQIFGMRRAVNIDACAKPAELNKTVEATGTEYQPHTWQNTLTNN